MTGNAVDARALLAALGIDADDFRIQWARTVRIGAAGWVTLAIDVDLRKLSDEDRAFLVGLGEVLRSLAALHPQRAGVAR